MVRKLCHRTRHFLSSLLLLWGLTLNRFVPMFAILPSCLVSARLALMMFVVSIVLRLRANSQQWHLVYKFQISRPTTEPVADCIFRIYPDQQCQWVNRHLCNRHFEYVTSVSTIINLLQVVGNWCTCSRQTDLAGSNVLMLSDPLFVFSCRTLLLHIQANCAAAFRPSILRSHWLDYCRVWEEVLRRESGFLPQVCCKFYLWSDVRCSFTCKNRTVDTALKSHLCPAMIGCNWTMSSALYCSSFEMSCIYLCVYHFLQLHHGYFSSDHCAVTFCYLLFEIKLCLQMIATLTL